jgi:hypothetical protein
MNRSTRGSSKMKTFKVIALLCSFALVAMAFAVNVQADTFNKKTVITFSEPFEVPGVDAQILPAGTYVFKVLESFGDRNIVQIFNADETHLFTTILAINNLRLKPTEKTVLTFKERGEGQPQAIKAWFYPDNAFGQEFVYSKKRALELAKIVNEPVLAMPIETNTVPPAEVLKSIKLEAIKPSGEEAPVAEVVQAPPQRAAAVTAPVTAPAEKTEVAQALPHTASSLPLAGLIGLLSLCAGFVLVIITKRVA